MDIMLEDLNKEYNLRYVKEKLGGVGSVEALEGFMDGFYVSIQECSKKYRIKINVDKEINQERLTKLFNRLKTDVYDFKEAKFEKSYIELTVKNSERDIKQAVETAINFLTKEESKSKCAFCGKNESKISYTTLLKSDYSEGFHLCENCVKEIENEWEKEKEEKQKVQMNFVKGFLGSLIGALIIGISWIIVGMFGKLAIFTIILISAGAVGGFTVLGKKINLLGIAAICVSTVIGIWFSHLMLFSIKSKMGIFEVLSDRILVNRLLITGDMITAVVLGIGMSIFGARMSSKELEGVYEIKRF